MAQDYYQTLGISKTASAEDIKRAYRKLAHQYHPDKDKGDAEKFKQVSEAYQVLSDPSKRSQYDQFGQTFNQNGFGGFSAGGGPASGWDYSDFSNFAGGVEFEDAFDIFSDIFGRNSRTSRREKGVDLEVGLHLSFREAVFGAEKEISIEKQDRCATCKGSGAAPGSKINTCLRCHGQGQIRTTRRTIFGNMASSAVCDVCEGTGKTAEHSCAECRGSGVVRATKRLKVKIPAGVDDGNRLRVAGEGQVGYKGSSAGDLFIRISVEPDPVFKREGNNIFLNVPISFYQAALGTAIDVDTVDGKVKLKIPAGTQSGKVLRLKEKGVPRLNGSGRGDLLASVVVVTPGKLTKKEKELFKQMAEEKGETVDVDESFWSRFTS